MPLVAVLVACGGGGGSAGTTGSTGGSTGSGTDSTVSFGTILSVVLKQADSNNTSAESISAKGDSVLESTLTTKAG